MKFFQIIPSETNLDFIGKFKYFLVFSVITLTISIAGMLTRGFNFGVDFTGGTVVQVKFTKSTTAEEVRKLVAEIGQEDATVVASGSDSRDYIITARAATDPKSAGGMPAQLVAKAGKENVVVQSVDIVGPKVGEELKASAMRSLFYSVLLITIYIWFRFDFKFAPGATFAMIHDIIIAAGLYVYFGLEFNITAIAALLTIAGYSVNDTIVIYDRVRELLKAGGDKQPLPNVINRAVNLTLSRTMLTSGVTLISLIPIAIFCDGEIRAFAQAMMVGIFVGTYSTIYIAAPLTIYVEKIVERQSAGTGRTVRARG